MNSENAIEGGNEDAGPAEATETSKAEYCDKISEQVLAPEPNDAEIERRNEEKRRKVREILGIN